MKAWADRATEQLSALRSLFVLSLEMFDATGEDEIIRLCKTAVPALGPFRCRAGYLLRDGQLHRSTTDEPATQGQVEALDGNEGPIDLAEDPWAWAYPLRSHSCQWGYLVIGADIAPSEDEGLLLRTLVQQTGAALAGVGLLREQRERADELRDLGERLAVTNDRLTATVADLELQTKVHEVLTRVSARGGGEAGIATALHELTDFPVAVEDRFGNLRAWAGPERQEPYPKPGERSRAAVLRQAQRAGGPVRDGDRLITLAQPRDGVLGVLALIDPDRVARRHHVLALEHAGTVLAVELANQHIVAEVELRLRRDLVEDLISGVDDGAITRARALGHDLQHPHRVIVVRSRSRETDDAVARAVEQTARLHGVGSMLTRRAGTTVWLARCPADGGPEHRWQEIHTAIARHFKSGAFAVGVGGPCERTADIPRSWREATRALAVRQRSVTPDGVTAHDDLGMYRILGAGGNSDEVDQYIREWLGSLLDYDARHRADLVVTLSSYLEHGGNYDATAHSLTIHRSTLRYRLQRIREVSGYDLGTVDHRLNLHIATRALAVLHPSP
ncbi:PucR family transcriptional regulator [Pseudonocardia kunmingensis]|uniref:CdaR family transcriptional regulator n=1 Tax=Pseudonocardia kunmingensis TaxID=630975 RepID=A0A543DVF2_9PSEU|nr:helix-turn-helix domain-containing protein [Pseudonocardia kunmingensis]TQM13289.1 CdaR family transcriptional regulator [Pseudonocardia kunmingensis]